MNDASVATKINPYNRKKTIEITDKITSICRAMSLFVMGLKQFAQSCMRETASGNIFITSSM
jgi:hypothetical protein